jgi:hypothetical protein
MNITKLEPWPPKLNAICCVCQGAGNHIKTFKPFVTTSCPACFGQGVITVHPLSNKTVRGGSLRRVEGVSGQDAAKLLKKSLGKTVRVWFEDDMINIKVFKGNVKFPKEFRGWPVKEAA